MEDVGVYHWVRRIIRWKLLGLSWVRELSLGEGGNQVETVGGYHWVRGIIRWRLLGIRRSIEERGRKVVWNMFSRYAAAIVEIICSLNQFSLSLILTSSSSSLPHSGHPLAHTLLKSRNINC